ncbi:MAG TPA: hypothetical protein VK468_07285 [Pyrinomonadaceae bacterium]|nr:hypothetical protein [Pyrinomonadaceae bacterium]
MSESEFERICKGILTDRETIIKHNPIGTRGEILLWMLLNCLSSYLSLTDMETPCFTGIPDAETYAEAIRFVLRNRKTGHFDEDTYITQLLQA